jgi:3,4-dihydroxy 2-butanone 4-phosphate synthase/GTP cyclohydrolase II
MSFRSTTFDEVQAAASQARNTDSPISPIEDILEDARQGRPVVIVDADDRENEGDLIIPAQFATPEVVNFMARFGRA